MAPALTCSQQLPTVVTYKIKGARCTAYTRTVKHCNALRRLRLHPANLLASPRGQQHPPPTKRRKGPEPAAWRIVVRTQPEGTSILTSMQCIKRLEEPTIPTSPVLLLLHPLTHPAIPTAPQPRCKTHAPGKLLLAHIPRRAIMHIRMVRKPYAAAAPYTVRPEAVPVKYVGALLKPSSAASKPKRGRHSVNGARTYVRLSGQYTSKQPFNPAYTYSSLACLPMCVPVYRPTERSAMLQYRTQCNAEP